MNQAEFLSQKPFTLSLSSGFFGFFAHAGFIRALEEKNLKPKLVVGSSAGALTAACFASGLTAKEMTHEFTRIKKSDFWDVGFGFGLVRGEKLEKLFSEFMAPDFSKLSIPLQISAFDLFALRTKTLSTGSVAKAARASCAVPGLFHPVRIDKRTYLDGGVADKMGLSSVDRNDLVLCHSLGSTNGFESKRVNRKNFKNLVQVELSGIPRSGPDHLYKGPEIIDYVHKQTKAWLETPIMPRSENSSHNIDLTL